MILGTFTILQKKNAGVKRWVIYNGYADSSKVPASWHSWLHHVTDSIPNRETQKKSWHKNHLPNLTGTDLAYKPPGSLLNTSNTPSENKYYTSWDPSSSENKK
jgi:NADH:ubiquinone oxidoreductase subunit